MLRLLLVLKHILHLSQPFLECGPYKKCMLKRDSLCLSELSESDQNFLQMLKLDVCSDTSYFIGIQQHPKSYIDYRNRTSLVKAPAGYWAAFGLGAIFSSHPKSAVDAILMKCHVTNSSIVGSQSKHDFLK